MSVSSVFIRRPVATTLLSVSLFVFGWAAYQRLPVADLPNVDLPAILVIAQLPGADPENMAASVATPLERQFSTIAGLQQMTSSSTLGSTQVTLLFDLDRDIDAAAQDVQAAIAAASPLLPAEMPSAPTYEKVNPADQPILYIALTSKTLPLRDVTEYANTVLAQRISMVSGVAQVVVFGNQKFAVRIELDPAALAYRSLGVADVVAAIQAANVNLPSGLLEDGRTIWYVDAQGQLESAAAYENLVIAYREGRPVRLGEVGRAVDGVENARTAGWYRDREAIVLAIQRQPGTNTIAVSDAVKAILPELRQFIPASIDIQVVFDQAEIIRESVAEVEFTLVLALILVVVVIFLFLRSLRATVIPSLALPLSVLGTFAVIYLLGYSLNILSLLALTLSIGFVIDDAIVMLENIVRHQEMGKDRLRAAFDGAAEIGFTIVSMTISLAAVFIPVLFLGGVVGRLFREFAVTIAVAILWSGVVALSLTPMASSLFLRPPRADGRLYRASERIYERALRIYDRWLAWSLDHRSLTLAYSALILIASGVLFFVIPKGFLPDEDTNQVLIFTQAAEDVSFERMRELQLQVNQVLLDNPAVSGFVSAVGSFPGFPLNNGIAFVQLFDRSDREVSAFEIVNQLRASFAELPDIEAFPQIPPTIPLTGVLTTGQYQYTLMGLDRARLYESARRAESELRSLPFLRDVSSDLRLSTPKIIVRVDRDRAAAYGISMLQIEDALFSAYGTRQISSIYTPRDTYRVILELGPEFRQDPQALENLWIGTAPSPQTGLPEAIPLSAVAAFERGVGPLSVNHFGQLPAVTLSFNLAPGASLGAAVDAIRKLVEPLLPETVSAQFAGAAETFQESFQDLVWLAILAVLVIYVVLGILYESFVHPITILSALPFAGFGALLTLLLFGRELDVYAFVGIVMLVGLVKKNGIMMVDFALEAERGGADSRAAIHRACLVRFRPIMMTTVAALAGTLPIAVATGMGAESRRALGLAVVGGLLFSQLFTLFVTPVIFLVLDRFRRRVAGNRAGE